MSNYRKYLDETRDKSAVIKIWENDAKFPDLAIKKTKYKECSNALFATMVCSFNDTFTNQIVRYYRYLLNHVPSCVLIMKEWVVFKSYNKNSWFQILKIPFLIKPTRGSIILRNKTEHSFHY